MGLITVPNASRPIIIRKKTRDTKRKIAPGRWSLGVQTRVVHLRPFLINLLSLTLIRQEIGRKVHVGFGELRPYSGVGLPPLDETKRYLETDFKQLLVTW